MCSTLILWAQLPIKISYTMTVLWKKTFVMAQWSRHPPSTLWVNLRTMSTITTSSASATRWFSRARSAHPRSSPSWSSTMSSHLPEPPQIVLLARPIQKTHTICRITRREKSDVRSHSTVSRQTCSVNAASALKTCIAKKRKERDALVRSRASQSKQMCAQHSTQTIRTPCVEAAIRPSIGHRHSEGTFQTLTATLSKFAPVASPVQVESAEI